MVLQKVGRRAFRMVDRWDETLVVLMVWCWVVCLVCPMVGKKVVLMVGCWDVMWVVRWVWKKVEWSGDWFALLGAHLVDMWVVTKVVKKDGLMADSWGVRRVACLVGRKVGMSGGKKVAKWAGLMVGW